MHEGVPGLDQDDLGRLVQGLGYGGAAVASADHHDRRPSSLCLLDLGLLALLTHGHLVSRLARIVSVPD